MNKEKNIYRENEQEIGGKKYNLDKFGRFIVSGGTGAVVNIGLLFLLTHTFNVWYLASSVTAFVVSFCSSFMLQKFWTFGNRRTDNFRSQAAWYLTVALVNLGLNTFILYVAVEWAGLHYILGQVIASALIAIESYFAYKTIFRDWTPIAT